MIRMLGVFLIMGATLWFGAYFAMKEKYRLQELEELERGLFYLQGQISYLSAPLGEAMESIGWKIQGQLGDIFRQLAESFAEIFFGNASGIGMPCVCATHTAMQTALRITADAPQTEWTLDLESMTLSCPMATLPVTMPAEPREALMQGRWDAVVELMNAPEAVEALSAKLPAPALS